MSVRIADIIAQLEEQRPRRNVLGPRGSFVRWEGPSVRNLVRIGVAAHSEEYVPLSEWENDPVGFARDILGVELWPKQVFIAESLVTHQRVTVAACYASGKSLVASCLVLWWIYTRRPALVITTAPTGRQVKNVLWREIKKLWRKAKRKLAGRLLSVELQVMDDVWAMGFSGDNPNTVSGLHEASGVLFIEDESAGMQAEIIEGYEGITATEGSRHLKIGNPLCVDGPFWDSHNKQGEMERWVRLNISALECPNVVAGKTVVPGLVSREWVEDKRIRWGESSPLWITKVLGQFFTSAGNKVVPAEWVKAAQERWPGVGPQRIPLELARGLGGLEGKEQFFEGPRILGIDVAGGGRDETVLYLRQGRVMAMLAAWQIPDLMEQARKVAQICIEEAIDVLVIDKTGLGQGLWQRVLELQDNEVLPATCEVVGCGLQEKPSEEGASVYGLKIDEVQFLMRTAFDPANENSVCIDPSDTELAKELSERSWSVSERGGKIVVESKRELRKRKVDSPDRADAASLTFAPVQNQLWWG